MKAQTYEKKGYLHNKFRLFHLKDTSLPEVDYHYHEFDKIILFISGRAAYMVEGRSYELQPNDLVLVGHNDIHRPSIDFSVPYERIVLYLSPEFVDSYRTVGCDLSSCMKIAAREQRHVLRLPDFKESRLQRLLNELEQSISDTAFGSELFSELLFLEFMVCLNRLALDTHPMFLETQKYNQKVVEIIQYINSHLHEDLSIGRLSDIFYISKYYLMRLFKTETGYTLGNYISHKRLFYAKDLVRSGVPVTEACYQCGYRDYSTFSRAFKQLFGEAPSRQPEK